MDLDPEHPPKVEVDANLVALVTVWLKTSRDAEWDRLLRSYGYPPGGNSWVSAIGKQLRLKVDVRRLPEALDWLYETVSQVDSNRTRPQESREDLQHQAITTTRQWWAHHTDRDVPQA
jgi:hypothetical protein